MITKWTFIATVKPLVNAFLVKLMDTLKKPKLIPHFKFNETYHTFKFIVVNIDDTRKCLVSYYR
jgi:hypothetical protein